MTCRKLVAIQPGAQKLGSRECAWFPVPHEAPPTHRECEEFVVDGDCERCGPVDECDVVPGAPCDGHKREIR